MAKPVLGYWKLRGLVNPIRFIAAYTGTEIEEKYYEIDQSGLETWPKEKFTLGLDFPNLPYWKEGDIILTESKAIMKYIAREKGNKDLIPSNPDLLRKADMLENVLWDVWYNLIRRCINDTEDLIQNIANNMPAKFEQLEKFLGGKKFLLGDKLSYVDFMLYETLFFYTTYDSKYLNKYNGLEKFKKNFEAIPQIAKYMASPAYIKSPCIHPIFCKYKM